MSGFGNIENMFIFLRFVEAPKKIRDHFEYLNNILKKAGIWFFPGQL